MKKQNLIPDANKKNTTTEGAAPKKMSFGRKIRLWQLKITDFIAHDIWHIKRAKKNHFSISLLKSITLVMTRFTQQQQAQKAAALAFNSVLAIVPMLAIIIGIAKGFGVQKVISEVLQKYGPMHGGDWEQLNAFAENTLNYANSGLFVGLGLVILLYTVYNLLTNIEINFNAIWDVAQGRSVKQRLFTFFSLLLLLPILLIAASGLTITMNALSTPIFKESILLGTTTSVLLKLIPFVILIFTFTAIFMILPNTRVRFWPALLGGSIAGVAFQVFQMLYVGGVMWVSRYSAIYGSFASFFLLLLWMQLAWQIILLSMTLTFVVQNIDNYYYFREVDNISRRYFDFAVLVVMHKVIGRFHDVHNNRPYTYKTLSKESGIPERLIRRIVKELIRQKMLVEVIYGRVRKAGYFIPAGSTERFTDGYILQMIDCDGSEDFSLDRKNEYAQEWHTVLRSRSGFSDLITTENETAHSPS